MVALYIGLWGPLDPALTPPYIPRYNASEALARNCAAETPHAAKNCFAGRRRDWNACADLRQIPAAAHIGVS